MFFFHASAYKAGNIKCSGQLTQNQTLAVYFRVFRCKAKINLF